MKISREKQSTNRPSPLKGHNYSYQKSKMTTFIVLLGKKVLSYVSYDWESLVGEDKKFWKGLDAHWTRTFSVELQNCICNF